MTAVGEEAPRTSPRFFVRSAWVLHSALYRRSGGRIGLSRPKAGGRFGMMRLTTLGRRSGQPRVAIMAVWLIAKGFNPPASAAESADGAPSWRASAPTTASAA